MSTLNRIWDKLRSGERPALRALVAEINTWIDQIKDKVLRSTIAARIKTGQTDHDHFSARAELFFVRSFESAGIAFEVEPSLPDSKTRPDFLVHHPLGDFYLEVTTRTREPQFVEMSEFSDQLQGALNHVQSRHMVSIDISMPCPFPKWIPEIVSVIENRLATLQDQETASLEWNKRHPGKRYRLRIYIKPSPVDSPKLLILPTFVGFSNESDFIYNSIAKKASKYGDPQIPLVIAIRCLGQPTSTDEEGVLYGNETLTMDVDEKGNTIPGSERPGRTNDGVFFLLEQGKPKYQKVDAVVFYQLG